MNKGFFTKITICIFFLGFCLYSYLDLQNGITKLRIRIPHLASEVRRIEEENTHLLYEIEAFESPENLLKLAQKREFSHLRFPVNQDVVTLKQAKIMDGEGDKTSLVFRMKPSITFATGANH